MVGLVGEGAAVSEVGEGVKRSRSSHKLLLPPLALSNIRTKNFGALLNALWKNILEEVGFPFFLSIMLLFLLTSYVGTQEVPYPQVHHQANQL